MRVDLVVQNSELFVALLGNLSVSCLCVSSDEAVQPRLTARGGSVALSLM